MDLKQGYHELFNLLVVPKMEESHFTMMDSTLVHLLEAFNHSFMEAYVEEFVMVDLKALASIKENLRLLEIHLVVGIILEHLQLVACRHYFLDYTEEFLLLVPHIFSGLLLDLHQMDLAAL